MPNAVDETSAVTETVFATRLQPDPPRAIISEEPERAWNAPEQPACDAARWLAMCLPTAGLFRTEKRKNT
jgi:hypothetical protein